MIFSGALTTGAVLVDGIDVREYHRAALVSGGLRSYLFSEQIADNLRYGGGPDRVVTEQEMCRGER